MLSHRLAVVAVLTILSWSNGPVLAQDTLSETETCGAAQVQWLAPDEDGQDISASQTALSAEVQVMAGQSAVLAFRTTAQTQGLRVEALSAQGDPAISLLTEDGDTIAENDDTPASLNSSLEAAVGPGVYCVALRSVDNAAMTATVQVSRSEQVALLTDSGSGSASIAACTADTPATALAEGAIDEHLAQGPISRTWDGTQTGYYTFTLSRPTPVTVKASSPTLDSYLKLFDSDGGLISENDDAEGLNARLDFVDPLEPGQYCIGAAALSAESGALSVSIETLDPERFLREAYAKGELGPPDDGSYPVRTVDLARQGQVVILHEGRTQWLGFDLDQPTVVIIAASALPGGADPKLVLFTTTGAFQGENDDVDGGINARLGPILLQPGRYHLGVVDVGRNDGTRGPIRPVSMVFERFLRAD